MTTPTPPSDLIAEMRDALETCFEETTGFTRTSDGEPTVEAYYGGHWITLNTDKLAQAAYAVVRERIDDPKLPFAIALAVQNSHYRAAGIAEKDELDAFTEQYVKDARTSLEAIRSALKQRIDP